MECAHDIVGVFQTPYIPPNLDIHWHEQPYKVLTYFQSQHKSGRQSHAGNCDCGNSDCVVDTFHNFVITDV